MKYSLIILFFNFLLSSAQAETKPPLEPPYTRAPASTSSSAPSPKPEKIGDDGEYFYEADNRSEVIQYKIDHIPPIKGAFYLRFGTMGPYDINGDNGATYESVYTKKSSFVVIGEYERYLGQLLGKWTLKFTTGLSFETGQGRFLSGAPSTEKFSFIVMPNTALMNYKLKFSDTQLITPYIEGGAGYFTFLEYRNDGNRTAFGGAGAFAAGGGLLISMNLIDKNAAGVMYEDYGVNHLWLDLQFRRYQGIDKKKDFSSNMITAGFGFAF